MMKKIILLTTLTTCILFSSHVKGQNYSLKDRWNIQLGYGTYPSDYSSSVPGIYTLGVNYGVLDFLEVGAYMGYGQLKTFEHSNSIGNKVEYQNIKDAPALSYGLKSSLHILPFIVKKKDFWLDLYLTGKYGGYTIFSKEGYTPSRKILPDYGIYGGVAVYPLKHVGLFGEYGYGNKTNLRFGLSFKF
jgi:hypothetical protein